MNHDVNMVGRNKELCSTDHYRMEERVKELSVRGEERDEKFEKAKEKVVHLQKEKLKRMTRKMERREVMIQMKQNMLNREAQTLDWLILIKLGARMAQITPKFKEARTNLAANTREQQLAQRIIGMWQKKKAPEKGEKYRRCVIKLRSFIKTKTAQWKVMQKHRGVDTLKQFLEDHKRANLPIIVANFIHSVKVWQRWWRNFDITSNNRLKYLLFVWEEVEVEWFKREEAKLHEGAERKKQVSESDEIVGIINAERKVRGDVVSAYFLRPVLSSGDKKSTHTS